jgi:hypothetical protein
MSKKKENGYKQFPEDLDLVQLISERSTGKGKFKGSKKEKKILKLVCPHNKYIKKKNGKKRPFIINDGHGYCTCKLCGARFPANFFKDNVVDKKFEEVQEIITQDALMAQSIGAPRKTVNEIANTSIMLHREKQGYKNRKNIAEKQDSIKKKKHGNGKGSNYSESLGGWRIGK